MPELRCDILIVGGGVGGCAAATAAACLGFKVVLTEETAWIGGQLTSQAVPPDEHPWIERFGCTARYREFRNRVRRLFQSGPSVSRETRNDPMANPGGGWVSRLCLPPALGVEALTQMLAPAVSKGNLAVLLRHRPVGAVSDGDRVQAVELCDLQSHGTVAIQASYVLDATETGELLPMAGVEHMFGAESQAETGEPHAVAAGDPNNVQGFTWCFAMGWDPDGDHTIDKPAEYERWRAYRPNNWPGPMLGWSYPHPITGKPNVLPLFAEDGQPGLFGYRQIVSRKRFAEGHPVEEATIVNWPQNDYFEGSILGVSEEQARRALEESKQLSLSLLYWLQTEAPRSDGGVGYPGLRLRPDLAGTQDGMAMAPYVRESRRIRALFTVKEQHVSSALNPGKSIADPFFDSAGIGAYRIDLHPSTSGSGYIDIGSLPFEIPLGAIIPIRIQNLLPACKNIGTTHITNGCYRLHPVEWNIGEAAGVLAAYCLMNSVAPQAVRESHARLNGFQRLLQEQGIPIRWPGGPAEFGGPRQGEPPLGPL